MMMQCICAPLASAATLQQSVTVPRAFNPPTQLNVALDEVSIVRLIALYSGNGNTSTLCTGLGAIVASWPQPNPLTPPEPNNLILTSGSVVSKDGTPCVAPSGTAAKQFTLQSLEVIFNTQFNDSKTPYTESRTNLKASDIRCADTTSCSAGMTLFSIATKFANPFVTVAGNRDALLNPTGQGQSVQLALAKNSGNALLPQVDAAMTNATKAQAQNYRATVLEYLNTLEVNPPTAQGEPGLLTIDALGNATALQLAGTTSADQTAISNFLSAQPEWVPAQNQWNQQDANTVQASWRMGNQQYYQQKNYPNASAAFAAAQINTNFVGTKEFATIAAHQVKPVGNGGRANPGAPSSPSSPTIPGTNIALPSWWWLAAIGVVVLLVLLVILLVVLLIRRYRSRQADTSLSPDFERDWEAAQRKVLQEQQSRQEAELKNAASEVATPIPEVEPGTTPNMTCPRCGTEVPKGASYCPSCSLRVVASDDKQTIQKSTTPVQQKPETEKPKPAPASEIVLPVQQNKEVPRPAPPLSPPFVEASENDKSLPIPSSSIAEPIVVKQGLYSDPVQKPELGVGERAGQQLNSYRLLHLVGQGGSADVYLGEHIYLKTKAAIKVLQVRMTGHDIQGFVREAQIIASLKHPHIVRILDFGLDRSTPFLIMEYAASGTLRDRYPRGTVLPLAKVLPYVKQIASALQYAHDQRLIHRDIKPENMLLEPNNDIILSDFGLATVTHTASAQNTKQVAGTALYMAPEQFKGKARAASDQYSLAVVVYEWLCGSPPYVGGDFIQLGFQHSYEALPPLREKAGFIAPSVEEVIAKALSKDTTQRYESVTAFVNALEQAATVG